jgi:hypothetical protein
MNNQVIVGVLIIISLILIYVIYTRKTSYNCTNNKCIEQAGNDGDFKSLKECSNVCKGDENGGNGGENSGSSANDTPSVCTNIEAGMKKENVMGCCNNESMSDLTYKQIENECLKTQDDVDKMASCCKADCKTFQECRSKYPCTTKYIEDKLQYFYAGGLFNRDEPVPDDYKVFLINQLLMVDNSDMTYGRSGSKTQCINYVKPPNPAYQEYIDKVCNYAKEGGIIGNVDITCDIQKYKAETHTECERPMNDVHSEICAKCANARDLYGCALFKADEIIKDKSQCKDFDNIIGQNYGMAKVLNRNYPCRKCMIAKYKKVCGDLPNSIEKFQLGPEGYEPHM